MIYYEVRTGDVVRFQSLSLQECEQHGRKIYKEEKVLPDIYEIEK